MVNIWESGDLVLTVDGISGDRLPLVASWEMPSGTFRGMTFLSPPLIPETSHSLRLPTSHPQNTSIWGQIEVGTPTEFDDKFVYIPNSLPADVLIDSAPYVSFAPAQDFDDAGNRYVGGFDNESNMDVIRKYEVDGSETLFNIDIDNDTNLGPGLWSVGRLRVTSDGKRAYWNYEPMHISGTSTFVGVNIYDLERGMTMHYYDLSPHVPSARDLADFAIGPVTGRIYLAFSGFGGFPYVAVIDPDTFEIINIYLAGNTHCVTHGIEINCDETLMAQIHTDIGISDIQIMDPHTGNPYFIIDYIRDMGGRELIRGMTFAACYEPPPPTGAELFVFYHIRGAYPGL